MIPSIVVAILPFLPVRLKRTPQQNYLATPIANLCVSQNVYNVKMGRIPPVECRLGLQGSDPYLYQIKFPGSIKRIKKNCVKPQ
jgi:hypothetical protein